MVLVSRTEKELQEVEEEITAAGGKGCAVVADVTKRQDIDRIIKTAIMTYDSLEILINNAGTHVASPFFEMDENEWNENMNINLKATLFLNQAALKIMKENRQGYIINVSSTAALQVPARAVAYGISKLGVVGLTQALYEMGKEFGVKVSFIYPGMTDTQMLRSINLPVDPSDWMLPEDITNCILFILKQSDRVVVKEIVP